MSEETQSANGSSSNGYGPPDADSEQDRMRIGGMALRNGLLVHGPTSWAIAARGRDGEIDVASGPKPSLAHGRLGKVPLLRGPLRLAEAFAVLPLARINLPSARMPFEDPAVLVAMFASTATSNALRRLRPSSVGRELAIAVVGALPALTALRNRDLAAYHGAEHKAIGGYERDVDPAEVPKEHERCGSNLIAPMVVLSIAGQVVLERLATRPGPLTRGAAALMGVGAAVELFVYAERNPGSALGKAVQVPGYEIQRRFSTREPTAEQLDVGVAAIEEVLRAERLAADSE
jgi:uncharacterized protein YqhQ